MKKTHKHETMVYIEDTDFGGVVYHANYLKFCERARTELLRSMELEQNNLKKIQDIIFVVSKMEIKFLKPAKLDDILVVETYIKDLSKIQVTFDQTIRSKKTKEKIFQATVKVVSTKKNPETDLIKLTYMNQLLLDKLSKFLHKNT